MSVEVITCSNVITLHALDSKQPEAKYTHHRGVVNCVNINHTNKVIGSCGQDGKLVLVTADKPETKLLENNFYPNSKEKPSVLSSCAFSHNSKFIAVGSVDSVVKVWDLRGQGNPQKQQNVAQIKSHMCGITSLAWVKNLRTELYGSDILASASSSGDVYLHSNKSGTFQQALSLKLHEGINCLRVSEGSDYCRMAACTNNGTLAVWDLMSGKDKPMWNMPNQNKVSMTSLSISSYSPVLLVTASVDQTLTFFDIHEKKSVKKITSEEPLTCVGLHSNGHTLVAGGMYANIFVYDLRNPSKPMNKLTGHEKTIKHMEFFKGREKEHVHTTIQTKTKAPSVSNSNHASAVSQGNEIKTQGGFSYSQVEIKSKENIQLPEKKTNNFIGTGVVKGPEEVAKEKKVESKLSSTGQEVMKTNSIKSQFSSEYSQMNSDGFKPRNRDPTKTQFPRYEHRQSSSNFQVQQLKQKVSQLQVQLKGMQQNMFEMQQRLNMTMIRQFQLHQSQMKELMGQLVGKEKQKDEYIQKLQRENAMLKGSTF